MYNQLNGNAWPKLIISTRWLLILPLVCAAAFVAVRYARLEFKTAPGADATPAASLTVPDDTETLRLRLDRAAIAEADAEAALYKSQLWMDRAATVLENDPVAVRRLQVARAAVASAASEIVRVRDELEIAKGILSERRNKP